jgi:uncharacterized protein (TIGR02391 family)
MIVSNYRVLTRRGQQLRSRDQVRSYAAATDLPVGLVHPEILTKARAAFLRGDYDVAVLAALRTVEVAVREAGGFRSEEVGVRLMRDAFNSEKGPLTDMSAAFAEREAMSALFAGAIGAAKNPPSHREVEMGRAAAVQLIMLASYLMSVVNDRAGRRAGGVTA